MANFMTRMCSVRNIMRTKHCLNLTAHYCGNHIFFQQSKEQSDINVVWKIPKCTIKSSIKYYSTNDGDRKDASKEGKEQKLSLLQKFKVMYRDYWYVLVPVHLVTSAMWFGGFYFMAKSGIDIVALLESWHVSERLVNPLRDSSMGYFAVSYALYKITTPARYTVTIGGTTISINYLKKWGYIKPVPSKERIKEIYEEKKETLTKGMKETREGIKEKKETLIETVREAKEGIIVKKDNLIETIEETKKSLKDKTIMDGVKKSQNMEKSKSATSNVHKKD